MIYNNVEFCYNLAIIIRIYLESVIAFQAGSLYNEGMQPVMYSVMEAKQNGVGWRRAGHSIKYFKTNIRR